MRPCGCRLRRHHPAAAAAGSGDLPLRRFFQPRGAALALRLRGEPQGRRQQRHLVVARRLPHGQRAGSQGPRPQGPVVELRRQHGLDAPARRQLHGPPGRVPLPAAVGRHAPREDRQGPDARGPLQPPLHEGGRGVLRRPDQGEARPGRLPDAQLGDLPRGQLRRRHGRHGGRGQPPLRALLRAPRPRAARAEEPGGPAAAGGGPLRQEPRPRGRLPRGRGRGPGLPRGDQQLPGARGRGPRGPGGVPRRGVPHLPDPAPGVPQLAPPAGHGRGLGAGDRVQRDGPASRLAEGGPPHPRHRALLVAAARGGARGAQERGHWQHGRHAGPPVPGRPGRARGPGTAAQPPGDRRPAPAHVLRGDAAEVAAGRQPDDAQRVGPA
mmetsp:Transcript_65768/g.195726  ORF Transcript_65768/g.195726 Transcript_65768/m.195726 type:complete len:381 (-) Transcript_65768:189-1331(-)